MTVQLCTNQNCINEAGVIDEGHVHGRADVRLQHHQIVTLQPGTANTEEKFRLGNFNVGIMRRHKEKLLRH